MESNIKISVIMPVYGVVSKQAATAVTNKISGKDIVDTGYFAILEEGSSLANLYVSFGGITNRWGTAYATFTPYPSDEYDLSDTISVGNMGSYTIVSELSITFHHRNLLPGSSGILLTPVPE